MRHIDGADELNKLWPLIVAAGDEPTRKALVASAICAASRIEVAVHEARRTAVGLLVNASDDTIERAEKWEGDYVK